VVVDWHGTRVLVTGAGGFIGSHLVERLVEAGANVRALIHYNAMGRYGWLDESPLADQVEFRRGDVADADTVRRAVDGVDVVFHLAALIGIPYSYEAPHSYVRTNVVGTLNLLQAALDQGVRRLVHTSTSEVYGSARYVPIDEAHPLQGQSPYAASKIGADKMAEAFHASFACPVVTVRPFNTFGPRQSERAIIPTIISQCLSGRRVLRLGNLAPTRDLNYVGNTVDGFLAAGLTPGIEGGVFNLGSGREISIGALATAIAAVMGIEVEVQSDPRRVRPGPSEVDRLLADSRRACEVLGWRPAITLEQGLERTVAWLAARQEGLKPDVYMV
jgi:dTDP-glucose 4,6-dehydratase